jgi:hypothetical protein
VFRDIVFPAFMVVGTGASPQAAQRRLGAARRMCCNPCSGPEKSLAGLLKNFRFLFEIHKKQ